MDFDFDGNLDILTGCYWTDGENGAHLQILKGKGDMDFAAAESVTNVAGKPLQNIEISGNEDPNLTKAICTQQHVVDYDGDGDLDIVMGCFSSQFYLYENTSDDSEKIEISEKVTEIEIPGQAPGLHHSAPHLVDWDSDGDLDLLTGSSSGGAMISMNVGTRQEPKWSEFQQLLDPSQVHEQFDGEEIKLGPSTRIWATDFNKDGLLDLLVGDSVTISKPKEGLTKEEWQEKKEAHQAEMMAFSQGQQKLMEECQQYTVDGKEMPKELEKKMQDYGNKFSTLYSAQNEFQTQKRTGHVWVLLQKSKTTEIATAKDSDVSQLGR